MTMTEQNGREIRIPGGTVRLTEEAWEEQAPTPALQERAQAGLRETERRRSEEESRETRRRENLRTAKFTEALDAHYRDRRQFYRVAKGTPGEVFDEVIWPKLAEQFVLGEEDTVDQARRERSTDVY